MFLFACDSTPTTSFTALQLQTLYSLAAGMSLPDAAHLFLDADSMLYNGLHNNLNTTIDPEELLLPNVFEQYHKNVGSYLYNSLSGNHRDIYSNDFIY